MENQPMKVESKTLPTGQRIRHEIANGNKIRDLQNSQPVTNALARVYLLVGVKTPTEPETQILKDYIRRYYANYTAEEIVLAFEMAISGDFNADLEHFGQFTVKYLSRVFKAYLQHRNKVAVNLQIEQEKQKKHETDEQKQAKIDEFYGEAVDLYRNSAEVFEGSKYHANVLYDELKVNFTDAELVGFKRAAGKKLKEQKLQRDELKRKYLPIPDYLQGLTFTESEWRRQTALLTVNESLKRKITL